MKIRIDKFCSLATSSDWHTWLFHYNQELYKEFINKLRNTRGCQDNLNLMAEYLAQIERKGDSSKLIDFLKVSFPQAVVEVGTPHPNFHRLDSAFRGGILSYPKRKILYGSLETLSKTLENFISDKIIYRSEMIDDRVYVEYLDQGDEHLVNQIPAKNWLIGE